MRGGQRARRHVRPDGLPRLRPGGAGPTLVRAVGFAAGGARDGNFLRSPRGPGAPPRRTTLRRGAARRRPRVWLVGVSVHRVRAQLELERLDHARAPHLGLLALDLVVLEGSRRGALWLDEVRHAPARAAVAALPRWAATPDGRPVRGGVRARHGGRLLDPALRAQPDEGGGGLRRQDARLPVRARLALLSMGLGPVSRPRDPRPASDPADPAGGDTGTCRRRGGDPAAKEPAAPRRPERGAARRLRARPDALVVPLHSLVPPLRAARAPSPCADGRAARAGPPCADGRAARAGPPCATSERSHGQRPCAPGRVRRCGRGGRGGRCLHRELRGRPGDHRHAGLPALRREDRVGRRPVSRLPPRVPAAGARPLRVRSRALLEREWVRRRVRGAHGARARSRVGACSCSRSTSSARRGLGSPSRSVPSGPEWRSSARSS